MEESKYYLVKVKEKFVDVETNKVKTTTRQKLVDAMSITEAEVKTVKLYEGCTFEWKITSVAESPIDEILE
jgi:hypothetical protein|tara:strand:- start:53 stop:265 length:213 start_codon:yes stop_codon:yes gene_type:complete